LEGDNLIGAFSISQHKLKESLLNIDEPKIFCETRPWLPTAFKKTRRRELYVMIHSAKVTNFYRLILHSGLTPKLFSTLK